MITIIDYNMGNIGSIANMFKKIGVETTITNDIEIIKKSTKLILPGVGHFDKAISNLKELNLVNILNEKVLDEKIPILGICLGMHILGNKSEEGKLTGLGWIKGEVKKFSFSQEYQHLKVPHMGWNIVKQNKNNPLIEKLGSEPRYYFVHSYHFVPKSTDDILLTTPYGFDFVSAIASNNIMGVQFHPEKSHKFGMQLLKNFAENV